MNNNIYGLRGVEGGRGNLDTNSFWNIGHSKEAEWIFVLGWPPYHLPSPEQLGLPLSGATWRKACQSPTKETKEPKHSLHLLWGYGHWAEMWSIRTLLTERFLPGLNSGRHYLQRRSWHDGYFMCQLGEAEIARYWLKHYSTCFYEGIVKWD